MRRIGRVEGIIGGSLLSLATTACGPGSLTGAPASVSLLHSDSGIGVETSYDDIIAGLRAFSAKHPDLTEISVYGTSTQGRPLTVMKIQDPSVKVSGNRPAVLISEAIHGNEYLDIADRLPREFIEGTGPTGGFRQLLAAGGVLYIVPVANPDGFSARQRENGAGIDLNRDFTIKAAGNTGFTQPETSSISAFIAREAASFDLTIEASLEYHCCIGGLIHPWNYDVDRVLTGDQATRHQEVGDKVRQLFGYPSGNVRDVVNYQQGAVGGSDDYYLETYGRRAFSFEGAFQQEAANLPQHVAMWDFLFTRILAERDAPGSTGAAVGPQASQDLYLAIGGTANGALQLVGSVPGGFDGFDVCIGGQDACRAGGATVHVGAAATTKSGGRAFFALTGDVPAQTEQLTLTATIGGRLDATALVRTVQVSKAN